MVSGDTLTLREKTILQNIADQIEEGNRKAQEQRVREGKVLPEPKPTEITPEGVVREERPMTPKKTLKKETTEPVDVNQFVDKNRIAADKVAEQKKTLKSKEAQKQDTADAYLKELQADSKLATRAVGGYAPGTNKPQVGDMTKYGPVVAVKEMGGVTNGFRVQVEEGGTWYQPEQIGGVYYKIADGGKPAIDDFDAMIKNQESDTLDPIRNLPGKRQTMLKQFAEEAGIDIDQITDPRDRQKAVDMMNARNTEKQWDLAKELREKYGDEDQRTMFSTQKKSGQVLSNAEAVDYIKRYFSPDEVSAQFVEAITTPDGMSAVGAYSDGLIKFVENPTKEVLDHEALHAYFDRFVPEVDKKALIDEAYRKHGDEIRSIKRKYNLSKEKATEEWIADNFSKYVNNTRSFSGKIKNLFQQLRDNIKAIFGDKNKIT